MARGSKPGERRGGRQKGVPNKATQKRQAEVAASGATPLDALLKKMRHHLALFKAESAKGKKADGKALAVAMDKAAEAARDAAPYVHPRLASIQHAGDKENPIQHAVTVSAKEELLRRFAEIAARLHAAAEGEEVHP
jgi:hypothetical protein